MPKNEWGVDGQDADLPINDPYGEKTIERNCTQCGSAFLTNLYFADRVGDESPLSLCESCIAGMLKRGGERVRAMDARNRNQD